ncbi:MAG TPA: NAD-dependent epimerase/dehydratase family protein [Gemmatimonadales bacterium]
MRVAVLGGTGFIGRHVSRLLAKAGNEVTAIHRGGTPSGTPRVRSQNADRHALTELAHALRTAAPQILVDMTAYAAADVERLLSVVPSSLERLVIISSADVYQSYAAFLGLSPAPQSSTPADEQAPVRAQLYPYRSQAEGPDDPRYSYEKILVERTARAASPAPVTTLRLPMVYGPGDRQGRVGGWLARLGAAPVELRLNDAQAAWRCTRGYVEDVAGAICLAALAKRGRGEVFNVGENDALSELEWVGAIAAAAGWKGRLVPDPDEPPTMPGRWEVPLVTSTRRIRTVLAYTDPIGRAEGLRRSVAEAGSHL